MKKAVKHLTLANLIFLTLMVANGLLSGWVAEAAYAASFVLPVILALYLSRGETGAPTEYLSLGRDGLVSLGALGVPSVGAVMGLSYLTSAVVGALGGTVPATPTELPFWAAVLSAALMPSILEEMLFRYLPMKLLLPHSPLVCVALSSISFAFAHRSAYSLLYALAAGAAFMIVNIASHSVWPSVILHFFNNVLSLAFSYYGGSAVVNIVLIVTFGLLFAGSVGVFVAYREKISAKIRYAFSSIESYDAGLVPLLFIVPCMIFGILEFAV